MYLVNTATCFTEASKGGSLNETDVTILGNNHRDAISSPLLYSTCKKQATGPANTPGETTQGHKHQEVGITGPSQHLCATPSTGMSWLLCLQISHLRSRQKEGGKGYAVPEDLPSHITGQNCVAQWGQLKGRLGTLVFSSYLFYSRGSQGGLEM